MKVDQCKSVRAAIVGTISILMVACGGGGGSTAASAGSADNQVANIQAGLAPVTNEAGAALTFTASGIDHDNPFFKPFGNGRSCASCHQESQGWSVTPDGVQERFDATNGTDPIFKLVDGANSPQAIVQTLDQKRAAYSMLLTKGVIRVGLPIPAGAEFDLVNVDDPYGFASAAELSLFRRPLPSTNLKFVSSVMWDARETFTDANSNLCIVASNPPLCYAQSRFNLMHQANSAVRGHAEAAQDLTATEQNAIVDFETSLFTAQVTDNDAGSLTANGAKGGPVELSKNDFYFGINDLLAGDYRTGASFQPISMTMFGAWRSSIPSPGVTTAMVVARQSIARGEAIFNSKPINIVSVNGLNDTLGLTVFRGTCTSCHDTPNSGTHSVPLLLNIGVADGALRTSDMPLYTLRNKTTGASLTTTDPGLAMQTGKWSDIGRVKVPSLRGIESRSPYFHNGSINDLAELVRFYDRRFQIGFNQQEIADLVAFLKAL